MFHRGGNRCGNIFIILFFEIGKQFNAAENECCNNGKDDKKDQKGSIKSSAHYFLSFGIIFGRGVIVVFIFRVFIFVIIIIIISHN
ncbi:hypothetical protein SDC9_131467 [bioreactor metagenome]|uniref:Uncharacterized protein n=1 Tax=bioreactor metagenome TaxID=1076179 RepID=A0A645D4U1_9ZZZZ